jgi:hypothetical protein
VEDLAGDGAGQMIARIETMRRKSPTERTAEAMTTP